MENYESFSVETLRTYCTYNGIYYKNMSKSKLIEQLNKSNSTSIQGLRLFIEEREEELDPTYHDIKSKPIKTIRLIHSNQYTIVDDPVYTLKILEQGEILNLYENLKNSMDDQNFRLLPCSLCEELCTETNYFDTNILKSSDLFNMMRKHLV